MPVVTDKCSTPFGITELGIRRSRFAGTRSARCSTPFGITEVGMRCYGVMVPADQSAQRLSASQRWASDAAGHCAGASSYSAQRLSASQRWAYHGTRQTLTKTECSTPFGITEVGITAWSASPGPNFGCSTPFGITEVGMMPTGLNPTGPASAQRLSASQRWAWLGLLVPAHRAAAGAQRLSASQRWAFPVTDSNDASASVCSTPFGITEVGIARAGTVERWPIVSAQRLSASLMGMLMACERSTSEK